jgi:hypothetical protein
MSFAGRTMLRIATGYHTVPATSILTATTLTGIVNMVGYLGPADTEAHITVIFESTRDILTRDPCQDIQHAGGSPDREVMSTGEQHCQRGGLVADPHRASRTQRQCQPWIGCVPGPAGSEHRAGRGTGGRTLPASRDTS